MMQQLDLRPKAGKKNVKPIISVDKKRSFVELGVLDFEKPAILLAFVSKNFSNDPVFYCWVLSIEPPTDAWSWRFFVVQFWDGEFSENSYTWSENPYKWLCKWVTGVRTPIKAIPSSNQISCFSHFYLRSFKKLINFEEYIRIP